MDLKWLAGAAVGLLLATGSAIGTEAMQSLGFPSPPAPLTSPSSSRTDILRLAEGPLTDRGSAPRLGRLAMSLTPAGDADCSTAFAVLTGTGQARLLSAEHCDPTGDRPWYDANGKLLTRGGASVQVDPAHDSMLITPIGTTQGYVYGDGWNTTPIEPRYRLAVTGSAAPHLGDLVCTSGANSGEHCGLVVIDRVLVACFDAFTGVCRAWQAEAPRRQAAAVAGDSGGPVYRDDGFGTVSARGVINSGAGIVRCPTTASQPYGRCFGDVFFIAIPEVLKHWGAAVQVEKPGGAVLLNTVSTLLSCSSGPCTSVPGQPGPETATPTLRPVSAPTNGTRPPARVESAEQVRTCGALRRTRLAPTTGIPNPCAQAAHLLRLFAQNRQSQTGDGYLVQVGKLGAAGLRIVVAGDAAAARRRLAADRLVEAVHSVAQGP